MTKDKLCLDHSFEIKIKSFNAVANFIEVSLKTLSTEELEHSDLVNQMC